LVQPRGHRERRDQTRNNAPKIAIIGSDSALQFLTSGLKPAPAGVPADLVTKIFMEMRGVRGLFIISRKKKVSVPNRSSHNHPEPVEGLRVRIIR
jgi:hypothetical protein